MQRDHRALDKTTTKGTGTFVVVFVPRRIDAANKRQFLE